MFLKFIFSYLNLIFFISIPFPNSHGKSCEFQLNEMKFVGTDEIYKIPIENDILYYSLCGSQSLKLICQNLTTTSCIIKNGVAINSGQHFHLSVDNNYDLMFQSVKGADCSNQGLNVTNKVYNIKIHLGCSDFPNNKPKVLYKNGCDYTISAIGPDCLSKCTTQINGNFIDLRSFNEPISFKANGKNFSLNLCGINSECGKESYMSSCEINKNSIIGLSKIENQSIKFNTDDNVLSVKGFYKESKANKKRNKLEISIRCDWTNKLVIKNSQILGSKYKFELESSYGCIKVQRNCLLQFNGFNYDLSKLYKQEGYWNVKNSEIILNICGDLVFNTYNECLKKRSQVCENPNTSDEISRGGLLLPFQMIDDVIQAEFTYGSVCKENSTKFYSTHISLICSKFQENPIFIKNENCSTFINWKTPHACPIINFNGQDCQVNNLLLGPRNLKKIANFTNRLLPNAELIYNFCGNNPMTCNGYKNVSICLKSTEKERIIGWKNTELQDNSGLLSMNFKGQICSTHEQIEALANVHFICDYSNKTLPDVVVLRDDCQFNITIPTPNACLSKQLSSDNCIYQDDDEYYDLEPLNLKNRNHILKDSNENITYLLNVCGPIISEIDALCPNSVLCLRNDSEPNLKKRFISLGGSTKTTISNRKILFDNSMGSYVFGEHYNSLVKFECFNKQEIKLLSKINYKYKFVFKTPHACPKPVISSCIFKTNKTEFNLSNIPKKNLIIKSDDKIYKFNICSKIYEKCVNGDCSNNKLEGGILYLNNLPYIEFNLNYSCSSSNIINKVLFKLECDEVINNTHFEQLSKSNCTFNVIIKDNLFCPKENIVKKKNDTKVKNYIETNNCSIIIQNNLIKFDMSQIKSTNINLKYIMNFDYMNSNCNGLLCRDDIVILPFIRNCSNFSYNYTDTHVKLQFKNGNRCKGSNNYEVQIWLKCVQNHDNENRIIQENDCNIILEFDQNKVCELLSKHSNHSTSIIVYSTLIICSTIFVLILITCCKCRCWKRNSNTENIRISYYDKLR